MAAVPALASWMVPAARKPAFLLIAAAGIAVVLLNRKSTAGAGDRWLVLALLSFGIALVAWILDATRGFGHIDREEAARLHAPRTVIAINKCDAVGQTKLLPLIAETARLLPGCEVFPTSARTGQGVPELVAHLSSRMPAGDWQYDPELFTTQSERVLVGEMVREQLFLQLDEELPYRIAVGVDVFRDGPRHTSISATIYTDSDSTKRIIVGKGGARIKSVGIASRQRIEELLGRKVFLELFVKVKPGWQDDPRFLEELGI